MGDVAVSRVADAAGAGAGGSVARTRFTVWWLTGRSKRCSQIVGDLTQAEGWVFRFQFDDGLADPRSGGSAGPVPELVPYAKRLRIPVDRGKPGHFAPEGAFRGRPSRERLLAPVAQTTPAAASSS